MRRQIVTIPYEIANASRALRQRAWPMRQFGFVWDNSVGRYLRGSDRPHISLQLKEKMADPVRFELATSAFGGQHSIGLSMSPLEGRT